MARSNRKSAKRELAQASHDIDRALNRIQGLHIKFSEHHPEHTAFLELMAVSLLKVQEMIGEFWTASWGKSPENLERFRLN